MSYVPYKTASFLGPINEVHHLFAVMNNPCADSQCLLINITSIRPGKYHDPACELDVGDHAFIRHPSYVLYRLAETMRADRIGKFVDLNYYLTKDDWEPVIFQRIVNGIRNSDDTKPRVIKYADENLIG
ncbi:Hypothetical protein RG1141_CH41970 [Neorhizobium galegae bv. officinalis bv. officinalis str. HAMBI 1141]|uniref:Uncharacterized protein n=1 Tax=Neorhizobium galegae bv. officinalis bv. officinalis str. HAMBI 1141 TaxID=1028801 RepID=A0A068TEN4_NEOGA|nr:Hypothetical protein RG1141_CH41970 [Neorhizobium galegae bv. officinalis bv. officinalis str. HAMBI 1141]